jgi:hypothetical protein
MSADGTVRVLDTGLCVIAVLVNLLMIGIFLSRPAGLRRLERTLGLVLEALGVFVAAAAIWNALSGREWWAVALPALLVAFLLVELVLEYILQFDFRHSPLLGPYLLLYYLALMGMIGYAFLVSRTWGMLVLVTYFLQLAATAYSYARVGHGRPQPPSAGQPSTDGQPPTAT